MGSIMQDILYGFRRLRNSPGFATTAILTLALGIGATTAIFTLIYQVMLRSIPVDHPEQLYKVGREIECCVDGGLQGDWRIFSYDLYRTLRDQTPGTEGIAASQAGAITVSARRKGEEASQPLSIRMVSGNFFSVLGVRPFAGRLLQPDDDLEGAPAVAVISYAIWQSKFHSDPSLVGESVVMTGHPVTIVGISAEGFLGDHNSADSAGVWLALAQEPIFQADRRLYTLPQSHWLDLLVRIRDPKTVPGVESALKVELLRWIRANRGPSTHDTEAEIARQTTELAPAKDGINDLRDDYEKSLKMLQMITGFVLLIVCANLANLMLVRGVARRQELSIRTALGAPRSRLVREMLVEAIVLALLGGVLALGVAYAGVKGMLALAMKGVEINPLSANPSWPVLGFALAISAVTGVLFGIAPAWIASHTNPVDALRSGKRSTGDVSPLQKALVVLQAALSVGLLSTTGLLILSLQRLEHQDFRFQTKGRLVAFIDLQAAGFQYEQLEGLYRRIDQTFAAIPGLHDTAYATYGPMTFNKWVTGIAIEGEKPNGQSRASYSTVSPRFFDAVGTRVLMGRVFTEQDTASSTHVAVVNQMFVKKFLDGKRPIGVRFGPDQSMTGEYEIVGVVDDSKYGNPAQPTSAMFFKPMAQITNFDTVAALPTLREQATKNEQFDHFASNLFVRYEGNSATAAAELRRALLQINPDIVIRQLITYDDQVSRYFTRQKMVVRLTTIFGVLALILASLGLYGVTAYGVAQRVPEIGLRMALGADRASVMRLVLRGAAAQITIGLLLGVPLALLAGHFLESQLYEVKGYSASPLLVACAALALSALIASALPARRASSIEPMQALRTD
jgi:predicted permease